jgi:hypothetical protein
MPDKRQVAPMSVAAGSLTSQRKVMLSDVWSKTYGKTNPAGSGVRSRAVQTGSKPIGFWNGSVELLAGQWEVQDRAAEGTRVTTINRTGHLMVLTSAPLRGPRNFL